MSDRNYIQFFLGSNTKRGFFPLFEELRDPGNGNRMYILKGGPGSGKSSLMKRLGKALEEQGHQIEYIPCASDPNSLDAILDYDAKTSVVDGTAPHTLDPKYPGAYDTIINLGDAWDQNSLTGNKARIMELCDIISGCHTMATSCVTAAANLLETNRSIASAYVNQDVVHSAEKQISEALTDCKIGKERKRLLSAVSVGKTVFFEYTLTALCPKLYVIADEWGAASTVLLSELHQLALAKQWEVITCYCSIESPDKIDHLLFPSSGIGITTANSFHSVQRAEELISVTGLMKPQNSYDTDVLTGHLASAQGLIETACSHVEHAKQLHDELEAYYIAAMDFSKVDTLYPKLLLDILKQG